MSKGRIWIGCLFAVAASATLPLIGGDSAVAYSFSINDENQSDTYSLITNR